MPASIRSFAKINLGLVLGPPGMREDGFHELRTIYQTIALHDTVKVDVVTKGVTGIEIKCKDNRVPQDETNTCYRVAERVLKALRTDSRTRSKVTITIDKQLPVQGGMGAASSNAIATMLGIERMMKKQLPPLERLRIAEEVGSDVPLFLMGGSVLGMGRGEQIIPLPDLPTLDVVICNPKVGVSTPQAFRAWDELFTAEKRRGAPEAASTWGRVREGAAKLTVSEQKGRIEQFSREIYVLLSGHSFSASGVPASGGDRVEALLLDLVRTGIENDFERVVFPQFPELRDIKRALEREKSRYASLSGSGSTVFGIFAGKAEAEAAAARLNQRGIPAVATTTLGRADYWKML